MSDQRSHHREVGHTQDAGWEIGVSRTFARPPAAVWRTLMSDRARRIWLGDVEEFTPERGRSYRTSEGAEGQIRSYHEADRIRLTWQPRGWDHDSTVQIAISGGANKTTVRFHHDRLAGPDERVQMREHWRAVIDRLEPLIDGDASEG